MNRYSVNWDSMQIKGSEVQMLTNMAKQLNAIQLFFRACNFALSEDAYDRLDAYGKSLFMKNKE